ncbi:MAG: putative alcohol dehydrogenase adh [Acidimicrobiales bacterium]|nr:MAG: alcohol dehydrogenase [Actinomycetota bacterium]MBV6509794.1 putative alcohol dehydrogenase adh [Acidimicrobiales bacterium]RIK04393.1 MAG: alcohol dehydrogenase [Acidobacteriota bacterium]
MSQSSSGHAGPGRATALVLEAPRRLTLQEFDLPEITVDDALMRVEACGLCGTDHEQFTGTLPTGAPFIPGHESVGLIEEIGPVAADRLGVVTGDRVAVEVFQSCRSCERCIEGNYRHCRNHGLGDMYGFVPVATPPSLWGGYATHQYLSPDSMLLKVPHGLDPVLATVFNPLGAGIRWAVTVPETKPGAVVAILGPGIRGLCAVAAVREAGAGFVMVTGHGARDAPRLEMAQRFGADLTVDVTVDDPVEAIRGSTGGLADVVVDVTAKAPGVVAQAVELARAGGTIVLAGTKGSAGAPGFAPDMVVFKELRILGALGVDVPAYRAALDLLASGAYPFDELPRRTVSLGGAADLLVAMAGEGDETAPVHGVIVPEQGGPR